MTIILRDHDHTIRVGRVPTQTVLDLATMLPDDVRLSVWPDENAIENHFAEDPPDDWEDCGCCGGYHPPDFYGDCRDDVNRWPSTKCIARLQREFTTGQAEPRSPGYFGLAVALARETWEDI